METTTSNASSYGLQKKGPIISPPHPPLADRPFNVTFGTSHRQASGTWTDRRELSWAKLAAILTDHKEGAKDGSCIVPASLRKPERKAEHAEEISVLFLDSDCGHAISEIEATSKETWLSQHASTLRIRTWPPR